jgi:uncharacterized protein (DUF983 family)
LSGRPPVSGPSPLVAGLSGRCPCCGRGRLLRGLQTVSGDGPAAFIVLTVGFVILAAALVVEMTYSCSVWLHLLVWLPLSLRLSVGLMRPLEGLPIVPQHQYRRHELDAGA